ncbi:hypothetical protein [Xanthomonas albilineans]|uniref:hypothetical protein n=1 Tax=Xanthomonas albilineans TaxID=29447 RepID=UPI001E2B4A8F|nr:hypothetical protein [Xanthomonas albilineans]
MRTLIDFHVNRILDTSLMDHAGEHGRSDRATAEACRHNPDFGLRVLYPPFVSLIDEIKVHLNLPPENGRQQARGQAACFGFFA